MIINITRFKTTKAHITYENYKYAMFDIIDFLTNLQLQPEASGEWLHLYDDEDGIAWYTYIGDIVNEIYGEIK